MAESANEKKKVLLIGSSGFVGMATRDAITEYLGADVMTMDRPVDPNNAQKLKERDDKKTDYDYFVLDKNNTLDGKHANWLLRGREKLPETAQGNVSEAGNFRNVADIKKALDQNPDTIVVTAGIPRKIGEDRDAVRDKNAPFFEDMGRDIAQAILEKLKENADYKMPVIINVGNPMDTMTEVLGRAIHENLTSMFEQEPALKRDIARVARELHQKVVGMGGILDGARAAFALNQVTKEKGYEIPLDDIVNVPVLGTHNENMTPELEKAMIKVNGKETSLLDHLGADKIAEINAEVQKLTSTGGAVVNKNYKEVTGLASSAVLGTGAGLLKMVDAVINDKKEALPIAVYTHPIGLNRWGDSIRQKSRVDGKPEFDSGKPVFEKIEGAVMGQMVELGKEGVVGNNPNIVDQPEKFAEIHNKARNETTAARNAGLAL